MVMIHIKPSKWGSAFPAYKKFNSESEAIDWGEDMKSRGWIRKYEIIKK